MSGVCLPRLLILLVVVCVLQPQLAEGQLLRRRADGGLDVRAPRLGLDLRLGGRAANGGTLAAADAPENGPLGPRWRLLRRQRRAERLLAARDEKARSVGQVNTKSPTLAEAPPLPTSAELNAMESAELVGTLRDLIRGFHAELGQFDNPNGWQQYLSIPDSSLGTPGQAHVALEQDVLRKRLARFQKVSADSNYTKIARMPSFLATRQALELVVDQQGSSSPVTSDSVTSDTVASSNTLQSTPVTGPRLTKPLPTQPPSPEPRSGERSILKRR